MKPKTRLENFLAKIAGLDNDELTPKTRFESFLAKIAGDDIDITPRTRKEWFLNEISKIKPAPPPVLGRLKVVNSSTKGTTANKKINVTNIYDASTGNFETVSLNGGASVTGWFVEAVAPKTSSFYIYCADVYERTVTCSDGASLAFSYHNEAGRVWYYLIRIVGGTEDVTITVSN